MPGSVDRNPFAAADVPTLLDVLDAVARDASVNLPRRQGWTSALRCLAAWTHKPLISIPADPGLVTTLLDRLSPAALGVSRRHLQNVRSRLLAVLRHAGHGTQRQWQAPMTPPWKRLDGHLSNYQRASLRRLMRFCSAQGIPPTDVDDTVIADFAAALEADGTIKQPRMKVQSAARVWNRCKSSIAGWPQKALVVPTYRETYTLDWPAFPESFRADAEAYLRRLGEDGDLLAEDGPPRALTDKTIRTRRYQIRQFASALIHQGVAADEIGCLADLVALPRYLQGLRFFLDRNSGAPSPMIADLAYGLKVVARHWAKVDEATLAAMRTICGRLGKRLPGNGMTEKNRRRLVAFDDPVVLRRFLNLPLIEMPKLARQPVTRRSAAQASYLAALAILIPAPMRIKNIAALDLERHLRWQRDGEQLVLEVFVPANEVKNRQTLQFRITGPFASVVRTYQQHFRLRLAGPGVTALFPSHDGRPKRADTLSKQIARLVHDRVGIAFNPHLMRHLAAKISHRARPGDYESTRRLLGHASSDTTFSTYEGLETSAATEAYDRLIGQLAGQAMPEGVKDAVVPRRRANRRREAWR